MTPSALGRSANPPMAAFRLLAGSAWRSSIRGLAAAAAWLAAGWLTAVWPDRPGTAWGYTRELAAPAAGDGLAAACILHLSIEPQRQHVPDCARDRLSRHGPHLVGDRQRQQRLL